MSRGWLSSWVASLVAVQLVACSTQVPRPDESPIRSLPAAVKVGLSQEAGTTLNEGQGQGQVLARDARLLIYQPTRGDSWASIAARWLGDERRHWEVAAINEVDSPKAGQPVLVPLQPFNPVGVHPGWLQTVQILCYHRIGGSANATGMAAPRMNVSSDRFAEQLAWLSANDYQVVRLSDVADFLAGLRALPPRSVVLTFDDGYESFHRLAWPLLRRYGFPATVFVYTDFIGATDALTWPQLRELAASGLVDVQAHSRSHGNLAQRGPDETDEAWRTRIDQEVRLPREVLARQLGVGPERVHLYAYPYGDVNDVGRAALQRHRYDLAVTVTTGGNAFYAHPLMLRRTMIFGSQTIESFKDRLQTERAWSVLR